ncbi:response regulator [Kovacikia minuta CCNUW1]|uniref:response regulator n=1 Tax=Kovacikia minuta TaxID=2931930 RepID=UPI001CCB49FA|nr:response regulator [Kovacikia minuta]UBF28065.1 response regulator [Kovacikia minuta CCNUW1]
MKILMVEDDDLLVTVLTKNLAAQNYVVDVVKDGETGWTYGSTFEYDLMILDVMLPKLDGISLCRRFRAEGYTTPILLLTAQDTSSAKVQGLDAGADDYVVKPFDRAELVARIRALLRRGSSNPLPVLTWGDLFLNPGTCEVTYNGQSLNLTTKEYELLELLLRDSQHVYSSDEILDRLWSSEEFPSEATVRSHIRRLRHKLVTAGAPNDFIATVHGRGYYLKVPTLEVTELTSNSSQDSAPGSTGGGAIAQSFDRTPDSQQQYLAFLNETWTTTQPKSLHQLAVLSQTVKDLKIDRFSLQQQAQAQQIAHKLAGNLGIFGLTKAVHLARQLESWFGTHQSLQPRHATQLEPMVAALQQEVSNTTSIHNPQMTGGRSSLLLIVSSDPNFAQALGMAAANRGLRTAIAATVEAGEIWLNPELVPDPVNKIPDAILFHFPTIPALPSSANSRSTTQAINSLGLLQTFADRYPHLPMLAIGDRGELSDRLEVVQRGAKLFLEQSIPPEQVIATVMQLLGHTETAEAPTKVMIVDDDMDWLRTLPTLLKPWGFKVTTLADPLQFWTVLQAVIPDVLVLDVNMPQIDGYALCQVLRSDPQWQRLPVLFLSVLTDSKSQNQAFAVGADDFLCKPVMGVDLASRILNRLQRMRTLAS